MPEPWKNSRAAQCVFVSEKYCKCDNMLESQSCLFHVYVYSSSDKCIYLPCNCSLSGQMYSVKIIKYIFISKWEHKCVFIYLITLAGKRLSVKACCAWRSLRDSRPSELSGCVWVRGGPSMHVWVGTWSSLRPQWAQRRDCLNQLF